MQPDFNTTSQNVVNVDDFFLKFLQTETASVYLYSCNGVEFRLLFTILFLFLREDYLMNVVPIFLIYFLLQISLSILLAVCTEVPL